MAPVDLALDGSPDTVVEALLHRLPNTSTRPQASRPPEASRTKNISGLSLDLQALAEALDEQLDTQPVSYLRLPLGWPGSAYRFLHPWIISATMGELVSVQGRGWSWEPPLPSKAAGVCPSPSWATEISSWESTLCGPPPTMTCRC